MHASGLKPERLEESDGPHCCTTIATKLPLKIESLIETITKHTPRPCLAKKLSSGAGEI